MKLNNVVLKCNTIIRILVLFAVSVSWHLAVADSSGTINITGKAASDDFGRLFTAKYERELIDRARLTGGAIPTRVTGVDENSTALSPAIQPTQPIKLLGVLLRADGKNKIWLSGGTETQQNILNGHSIIGNINQSANLKVSVNSAAILKPGQVWSAATGRQEVYQMPVPKPVIEIAPVAEQKQPRASVPSIATQTSSSSNSEAQSSVSIIAK